MLQQLKLYTLTNVSLAELSVVICSNAEPLCQGFDSHSIPYFINFACLHDTSSLEEMTGKLCPIINITVSYIWTEQGYFNIYEK